MAKKNYITINGKHYDINTGQLVDSSKVSEGEIVRPTAKTAAAKKQAAAHNAKTAKKKASSSSSSSSKGVQKAKTSAGKSKKSASSSSAKAKTTKSANAAKSTEAKSSLAKSKAKSAKTARNSANKAPARTQKAKTLMRKAVKKPTKPLSDRSEKVEVKITKSSLGSNAKRSSSAKQTAKSEHVQKYAHSSSSNASAKLSHSADGPNVEKSQVRHIPVASASKNNSSSANQHHTPSKTASQVLIENALNNAQSHLNHILPEHAHNPRTLHHKMGISKKLTSTASASLAALLLAGFFAVQSMPNLSMRVASSKSGVNSASLPGYTPSGFSFNGPIDYSDGRIEVSFRSNSDDRNFTLTEQQTAWDSEQLRSQFLDANGNEYDTFLNGKGDLLYVYGDSNATWVKDGVWYRVEGDSKLTSDQLARIASSI